MHGVMHYPASKETCISMQDYSRMSTQSHRIHAPVPPWSLDDEKVRKVVAYRLALTAHAAKVPTTLTELRKLERKYIAMIRRYGGDEIQLHVEIQLHLEKVKSFGGPAAYYIGLIYRRFRLGMDSPALARHYGVKPTALRQTINRLCRIALSLFPNPEDHLQWHHTASKRDLPTLKIRAKKARRVRRPTFSYGRAHQMRQAGRTLQEIANHFGLKTRTAVMRALRKYEARKCN